MAIIEITYGAKCKDCEHLQSERMVKNDGNISKNMSHICKNPESYRFNTNQGLRNVCCDKFELK